ncbi:hypothetical protein [Serratia marcescens]|uniref:hypothetical protein n=1 Tax=Serratia marcescens TaxID=615 RepID=UPI0012FDCB55|nr:hypothetical protein [Serratia marcescens]
MTSQIIKLSKIDVAERQLNQSIRMFFKEADPVSIRTLAEAAGEVLSDIGDYQGIVRDKSMVKPEKYREWLRAMFETRNFFKHGKNDANKILDFQPSINDIVILDAVSMYLKHTEKWTVETLLYQVWNQLNYPNFWRDDLPLYKGLDNKYFTDAYKEKSFMKKMIDAIDKGELEFPLPELKSIES